MLLHSRSFFSSPLCGRLLLQSRNSQAAHDLCLRSGRRRKQPSSSSILASPSTNTIVCLRNGMDAIAEIAHNKVLIAAAVSAAVGQLTKPFSAAILYRKSFDFKAFLQAGGFPSTHSSAVVAAATSLGLERGFSDAIFGLAVVYASLTMYDAQGVRREVGTHAKALNRMFQRSNMNSSSSSNGDNLTDSSSENSSSNLESLNPLLLKEPSNFRSKPNTSSLLLRTDNKMNQSTSVLISSSLDTDVEVGLENGIQYSYLLKESVATRRLKP